jgi:hypothetical protein
MKKEIQHSEVILEWLRLSKGILASEPLESVLNMEQRSSNDIKNNYTADNSVNPSTLKFHEDL